MATAFVTGGTGFVGYHLIELLVEEGWEVIALHRPQSRIDSLKQLGAHRVGGDILDADSLERALPEGLEAVFHVAGSTTLWSPRNAMQTRINVEGTRNMVATALKRRVQRFIHTSSIVAYGFHTAPITEETPSNAADSWINYMRTKRRAEIEVHRGIQNGLDAVVLNPANIIGAHDHRGWAQQIRLMARGKLPGLPPGRGSFCSVKSVVKAHLAAFYKGRPAEHYLLGGADADFVEIAHQVGALAGCPVPQNVLPIGLLKLMGRLGLWASWITGRHPPLTPEKVALAAGAFICRSEKARREIDYRPVDLTKMLSDCIGWLRSANRL
jgi:nucleoside-diphosphate-sugar epimerase